METILIIDDEPIIQKLLTNLVESQKEDGKPLYEAVCKNDGEAALNWLDGNLPDLIICDVQMSPMDGYGFLDKLRNRDFTKHTPVVMLSGVESTKERIRCYTKRADDFLAKPFNPQELLALIRKNLKPVHYKLKETTANEPVIDTILIIDDEPITRKLLENLINNHNKDAKHLYEAVCKQDGKDALNWLEGNHPALIICDVQMKPMDGYDFLKNLRHRGYSKHTPVVMLSGIESSKERINCYDLGAQDFLAKPFNPDELWALIGKNLTPHHYAKTW